MRQDPCISSSFLSLALRVRAFCGIVSEGHGQGAKDSPKVVVLRKSDGQTGSACFLLTLALFHFASTTIPRHLGGGFLKLEKQVRWV